MAAIGGQYLSRLRRAELCRRVGAEGRPRSRRVSARSNRQRSEFRNESAANERLRLRNGAIEARANASGRAKRLGEVQAVEGSRVGRGGASQFSHLRGVGGGSGDRRQRQGENSARGHGCRRGIGSESRARQVAI